MDENYKQHQHLEDFQKYQIERISTRIDYFLVHVHRIVQTD